MYMVQRGKPKEMKLMKLMRISPVNHEFLASLCTKKGMSFDDALSLILRRVNTKGVLLETRHNDKEGSIEYDNNTER